MAEQEAAPRRKLPIKSVLVLLLVMLLEGGIFVLWSMFAGPQTAKAVGEVPTEPVREYAEIKIYDLQATNDKTGKLWSYKVEIVIECPKDKAALAEDIRQRRDAAIRDALSTIIRKADPQHLREPDLQTLRRQFHAALEEIFGDDIIDRVLIPRCEPYPI